MRRLVLTGFSKEEFHELKDPEEGLLRCYMCKRHHGKRGIYLEMVDDGPKSVQSTEMGFELISIIEEHKEGAVKFHFYLCHECRLLFEAMSEKLNQGESVFTKEDK